MSTTKWSEKLPPTTIHQNCFFFLSPWFWLLLFLCIPAKKIRLIRFLFFAKVKFWFDVVFFHLQQKNIIKLFFICKKQFPWRNERKKSVVVSLPGVKWNVFDTTFEVSVAAVFSNIFIYFMICNASTQPFKTRLVPSSKKRSIKHWRMN